MSKISDILKKMNANKANCCIILANLMKQSPRVVQKSVGKDPFYTPPCHYTTFWKYDEDKMLFFDSMQGHLSHVLDASVKRGNRNQLQDYDGLIFGNSCNERCLFYFNIPVARNMEVSVKVQNKIKSNLNAMVDAIFLKHLMLDQIGLKVPSLQLFKATTTNPDVYFENQLIEIKESTLRNPTTCKPFL